MKQGGVCNMTLILCVDDQGGLAFHNRRQSQDRAVRADMLELCKDHALCVTPYTAHQFDAEEQARLTIVQTGFEHAAQDVYCFLENIDIIPYITCAKEIVLYYWNRVYPSDQRLSLPLEGWNCCEHIEFAGYSHEKITREVYKR